MFSDVVIRVERLSKKYIIGHEAERGGYTALRDVVAQGAHNLWRKTADMARRRSVVTGETVEEFWALRDISFDVKRGEVLGIIGRNGAGKSTLLKILSRITEPSEGRVMIYGRVASLLEVGTGFHPELTGRENIYLNGAVLGMTRAEIRRKFDEIVAFAEIDRFLDTPVKRYSSGMYVRLAFAVAAHLEPEILVVDEVLAVGDAEFQKKCLGKMSDVASGGRTVLFVSHNLPAVLHLCESVIYLRNGTLAKKGSPPAICALYANDNGNSSARMLGNYLKSINIVGEDNIVSNGVFEGQRLKLRLVLSVPEDVCTASLIISDLRNTPLFELFDYNFVIRRADSAYVAIDIDAGALPLLAGSYSIDFWLGDKGWHRTIERINGALHFNVVHGSSKRDMSFSPHGSFYYRSNWRMAHRIDAGDKSGNVDSIK
jgi:ABC-type polysaccharide/polyol phosphate transport system ATPase subunit